MHKIFHGGTLGKGRQSALFLCFGDSLSHVRLIAHGYFQAWDFALYKPSFVFDIYQNAFLSGIFIGKNDESQKPEKLRFSVVCGMIDISKTREERP